MKEDVKPRSRYHAPKRDQEAAATRRAVLDAAWELFTTRGYAATTVSQLATRAGVHVDTLYATVGRKPAILRELVETTLSGTDRAVPAEERAYVLAIRAAPTARAKLETYASALAELGPRTAPIFLALRDAAAKDPVCDKLYAEIRNRRAANMKLFAADLRATGELRADLSDDEVADIIWSMNDAQYYALLVHERGWSAHRYGEHLADCWTRTLLVEF